jgi:hypothetical protein
MEREVEICWLTFVYTAVAGWGLLAMLGGWWAIRKLHL